MIKKLVTLTLVAAVVLSSSLVSFAEETETKEERPVRTESRERQTKEERTESLLGLFETYNPGELDAMVSALSEHELFHLNAKAYLETLKAAFKLEKETIKASYEAGEMSEEEFKTYVEEKRTEKEITKAEREIFVAEKKVAVEAINEQRRVVIQALREALKTESVDSEIVSSLLYQMLDLLNQHIEVDNYYFNLISEKNMI